VSAIQGVVDRLSAAHASLTRARQSATVAVDAANEGAERAALLGVARLVDHFATLADSCERLSDLLLRIAGTTHEATTAAQAVR
jgi:hypothetical protein